MSIDWSTTAGFAAVAALWSQISSIFARFRALFVSRVTLHGDVALAVSDYLYVKARILDLSDKIIRSAPTWVRPLNHMAEVAFYIAPVQPVIAILNGKPLAFSGAKNHPQGSQNLPEQDGLICISFLKGMFDIAELTRSALDFAMERQTTGKRYRVRRISGRRRHGGNSPSEVHYGGVQPVSSLSGMSPNNIRPSMRFLHWKSDDIGAPQVAEPFDAYVLDTKTAQARDDFRRWLKLQSWYQERGIPWRRGFGFHGPPGTGKTSLARALAQEADMPVFAFDLGTLSNDEFVGEWQAMQEHTPCMALIEDVDGCFNGRENILGEQGGGLTFDCLLNALGGIQTADGVFIVITTNRPETLDDTLGRPGENGESSRPGRIDRWFELPQMKDDQRRRIIERIVGACDGDLLAKTSNMTAAQVTEFAITYALENTWRNAA